VPNQQAETLLSRLQGLHLDPDGGLIRLVLLSLALFAAFLVFRNLLSRVLVRTVADGDRRYLISKAFSGLLSLLFLASLGWIWLAGGYDMAAFLGLLSAGLAFVLREPILNAAGSLYLLIQRPFQVGDRIQLDGGPIGDVVDIRLFDFSLMEVGNWVDADQSTGRVLHVPNGHLFTRSVANYHQAFPYIWDEVALTVSFESDWEKARQVLTEVGVAASPVPSEEAAEQVRAAEGFLIHYRHFTPIVWVSLAENGVRLTLRYLCPPRRRRSTASGIVEEVLRRFRADPGIDFALPTRRFFYAPREGKPGLHPPSTPSEPPPEDIWESV
jgi:small-conductance mechanosensitive channel